MTINDIQQKTNQSTNNEKRGNSNCNETYWASLIHSKFLLACSFVNIFFPYFLITNNFVTLVDAKNLKNFRSIFFLLSSILYLIAYTLLIVEKIKL